MDSERLWRIFAGVRRITVFLLGVWVIIAALYDPRSEGTLPMLIIGAVMTGVLPLDDLLSWRLRPRLPKREKPDE